MKPTVYIIFTLALTLFCCNTTNAQFFGQHLYSNGGSPGETHPLSSAVRTNIHSAGFLMTTYLSSTNIASKNFRIFKTDNVGTYTTTDDFFAGYKIFKDISCTTLNTLMTDTYGASTIETGTALTPTNGARYATVAACSGTASGFGLVFATLN